MASGFTVNIADLYGNSEQTVGPNLPLGFTGNVYSAEVGADANTALTTASKVVQVVTPTAARNYTLPSGVSVKKGNMFKVVNLGLFTVTVKASDASNVIAVPGGASVEVVAVQDNPTTNSHWANASNVSQKHQVRLSVQNGTGAAGTRISKFSTVIENVGTHAVYAADPGTNGDTFTAGVDGWYSLSCTLNAAGASYRGISLNSSQLTTAFASITAADQLNGVNIDAADESKPVSWFGYLSKGDVLRIHTDAATTSANDANARVTFTKMG